MNQKYLNKLASEVCNECGITASMYIGCSDVNKFMSICNLVTKSKLKKTVSLTRVENSDFPLFVVKYGNTIVSGVVYLGKTTNYIMTLETLQNA